MARGVLIVCCGLRVDLLTFSFCRRREICALPNPSTIGKRKSRNCCWRESAVRMLRTSDVCRSSLRLRHGSTLSAPRSWPICNENSPGNRFWDDYRASVLLVVNHVTFFLVHGLYFRHKLNNQLSNKKKKTCSTLGLTKIGTVLLVAYRFFQVIFRHVLASVVDFEALEGNLSIAWCMSMFQLRETRPCLEN